MMAVVDQLMCTASSNRDELRSVVKEQPHQSFASVTCSFVSNTVYSIFSLYENPCLTHVYAFK